MIANPRSRYRSFCEPFKIHSINSNIVCQFSISNTFTIFCELLLIELSQKTCLEHIIFLNFSYSLCVNTIIFVQMLYKGPTKQ